MLSGFRRRLPSSEIGPCGAVALSAYSPFMYAKDARMLLYKVETRESAIAGRGVYAAEAIPAGAIVGLLVYKGLLITESEYQDAQRRGDQLIIQSAIRLVGDYFIYNAEVSDEEYINYSTLPNTLYHCGVLFAKKNIAIGEELTADYKYFLAENDVHTFNDVNTNIRVSGLDAKRALLESCRELMDLMATCELDPPRYSDYKPK
jgi:SET domain-containing protein